MAQIQRIEFRIKTGNVAQGNAGSDSRIFCYVAGREFRLDKSDNPFGQGDNDLIVAGMPMGRLPPPNISNPSENDPNNYPLALTNLPDDLQPLPISSYPLQPIFIRYVPEDQQKGWQLEDANVRVIDDGRSNGTRRFFDFRIIGGQSINRWLGEKFGTKVGLQLFDLGTIDH
jgi:hypothetical protein